MRTLWICGICQNNEKELIEIFLHANKATTPFKTIWVDAGSDDETADVIFKHNGVVLTRKWTNDHDFQMNVYMRAGLIQHGDWVVQMDTSERIHPDFIDKLNNGMLDNFEKQNINTIFQRSKPILFRYHDDQIFLGSPHWGLVGQRPYGVDISKFDGFQDDKTYFWSNRDDINKWITNGIKYYYCYGRSNHMWLVYNPQNYPGTTQDLIQKHEQIRHSFRDYCRNTLGLIMVGSNNTILSSLDGYIKNHKLSPEFIDFMNKEKVIANYYRYLHGEDQNEIYKTQNTWKYPKI